MNITVLDAVMAVQGFLASLTMDDAIQVAIAFTGAVAIYTVNHKNPAIQRYGCLFGVAGEPFWLYTTWTTGAWGIFFLACIYTYSWLMGIYNFWIRPWWQEKTMQSESGRYNYA